MSRARDLADLGSVTDKLEEVGNTDGALSNRNLIINGAMQVWQRGTSKTGITGGGYHGPDRFGMSYSTSGTWTVSRSTDAPNGFGFSQKYEVTTAEASPTRVWVESKNEGQNMQSIKKGTADAEQVTLSFWVKASVAGTNIAEIYDADNARQCSKAYTINASNTWEYKSITFPADTTGTLNVDAEESLRIVLPLVSGSTYSSGTLNTTWASSVDANRHVGQTNHAATVGNTFQITGVQLERGDTATPFEHRSYSDELHACRRYFQRHDNANSPYRWFGSGYTTGTSTGWYGVALDPIMRAIPTLTTTDPTKFGIDTYQGLMTCSALTLNFSSPHLARISPTFSGTSANTPSWLASNGDSALRALYFDAEL